MLYCIVQAEDGKLVSSTTDAAKVADLKILAARGYLVVERPLEEASGLWDVDRKQFAERPAPPPAFPDPPALEGKDASADLAAVREWLVALKETLIKYGAI